MLFEWYRTCKKCIKTFECIVYDKNTKRTLLFIPENSQQILKLSEELIQNTKDDFIVMHPLPRNDEIPVELDNDRRCKYFEQVNNGVYVRMAVIKNCVWLQKFYWLLKFK